MPKVNTQEIELTLALLIEMCMCVSGVLDCAERSDVRVIQSKSKIARK